MIINSKGWIELISVEEAEALPDGCYYIGSDPIDENNRSIVMATGRGGVIEYAKALDLKLRGLTMKEQIEKIAPYYDKLDATKIKEIVKDLMLPNNTIDMNNIKAYYLEEVAGELVPLPLHSDEEVERAKYEGYEVYDNVIDAQAAADNQNKTT